MRKALCILVCIAICLSLGGCYDSNEISRLAFIIAIGIDKAEGDLYEYTFQAVNPSAFESGESSDEPIVSTVISASTIYAAMEKLNSKISEKCDYSHIKLAVFSQELMKTDSENILPSMLKSDSFHPNTRVAVSTGRASEYLKSIKIPLDTNPAEYYENIFNRIENVLGKDRLDIFHAHFSRIEFTPNGGEKKHHTLADTQYGPEFEPIAEIIVKRNIHPTIICESNGNMAQDALLLKKMYLQARG